MCVESATPSRETRFEQMASFLIGYDIRAKDRLQRVHRKMLCFAVPIQYSVFMLTGNDAELEKCLNAVKPLIDKKEDDLRFYRLPARGIKARLGSAVLPEGIFFTGMPSALQET